MSRIVNASVETALAQPHVVYAIFVDLDFVAGHLRAFNGVGEFTYDGQVYTGTGKFGGLGAISERADTRDFRSLTLSLSGVPADLFVEDVPDRAEYFDRSGVIYFVAFDLDTFLPLPAEPAVFEGFMDQLSFKREGTTASVQVTIRHHSTEWANTIGLLYTHEHQRLISSTDDICNRTHEVEEKTLMWGGTRIQSGGSGRDGGPRNRPLPP